MRFLFLLLSFLFLAKTNGQKNDAVLSFQLNLPQGDYKKTYNKLGTGFLFGIVHGLHNKSFIGLGGEIGFLQVSRAGDEYKGYFQNKYNRYSIGVTNYILTIAPEFGINLVTLKNSMKVFIDFTIGTNIFLTYSAISHEKGYNILTDTYDFLTDTHINRVKIDSSSFHSYWALRAGAGIGTAIPIGKNKKMSVLFKCSYLYGSYAKYFSHPTVQNLQITLVPKESTTSMLLTEAGFRFKIFNKKKRRSQD